MDITTIVGIIAGLVLICFGVVFDPSETSIFVFKNLTNFIDIPSVFIVLGGTLSAVIASYPASTLKQIPKHIKILLSACTLWRRRDAALRLYPLSRRMHPPEVFYDIENSKGITYT